MPKFIYTIMLVAIIMWAFWTSRLFNTTPDSAKSITIFLVLLYIALTLTVSIPIYLVKHKKAPEFSNLRKLYRSALKWAGIFALGLVGILALKAFDLLTIVNGVLFVILYLAIVFQMMTSGPKTGVSSFSASKMKRG